MLQSYELLVWWELHEKTDWWIKDDIREDRYIEWGWLASSRRQKWKTVTDSQRRPYRWNKVNLHVWRQAGGALIEREFFKSFNYIKGTEFFHISHIICILPFLSLREKQQMGQTICRTLLPGYNLASSARKWLLKGGNIKLSIRVGLDYSKNFQLSKGILFLGLVSKWGWSVKRSVRVWMSKCAHGKRCWGVGLHVGF